MLEEEISTIISQPSTTAVSSGRSNRFTLGEALDLMEERARKAGVQVLMDTKKPNESPPETVLAKEGKEEEDNLGDDDNDEKLSQARVLQCNGLVELTMTQAIARGDATVDQCGKDGNIGDLLVPGNVVAFYINPCNRFFRLGATEAKAPKKASPKDLPLDWPRERFLVVPGRYHGSIALYSPAERAFVRMKDGQGVLVASESQVIHTEDSPRPEETFHVQKEGLFNQRFQKCWGWHKQITFVQVAGFGVAV